jgi:hypothetical protein
MQRDPVAVILPSCLLIESKSAEGGVIVGFAKPLGDFVGGEMKTKRSL